MGNITTILDPIRRTFGVDRVSPTLIQKIERGQVNVAAVWEALGEWGQTAEVPPVPEGLIRPYIEHRRVRQRHTSSGPVDRIFGSELAAAWRELRSPDDAPRIIQAIKHHLLYCGQIALEDPIRGPVTYVSMTDPDFPVSRQQLAAGMQVLLLLEPLIDAGIVIITPPLPHFSFQTHSEMGLRAYQYIQEGGEDWLGPLEPSLVGALRNEVKNGLTENSLEWSIRFERAERLHNLAISLAEQFEVISHFDQKVDMYLPTAAHRSLLGWYLERAPEEAEELDRWPLARMEFLPALLDLPLPRLSSEDLSAEDIVAVRRDGLFEDWFASLGRGLRRVGDGADILTYGPASALEEIRMETDAAAHAARREVEKSSLLNKAREGAVDMVVSSGVGLVAATALGDPLMGLAFSGASLSLQTIGKWLVGRAQPGQQAVIRHAALFHQGRSRLGSIDGG